MKTKLLLLLVLLASFAVAQTSPDCQFTYTTAIAASQSPAVNNLFTNTGGAPGCASWIMNYWTNASSGTSVQIEGAADAVTGGVHGPTGSYTNLTVSSASGSGSNPATATTAGNAVLCCDYWPWIRITVNTLTSSGAGTQITSRGCSGKRPRRVRSPRPSPRPRSAPGPCGTGRDRIRGSPCSPRRCREATRPG